MKLVENTYLTQLKAGARLMQDFTDYAKSIGCTTYDEGPLYDSIDVHTAEQSRLLDVWWMERTREYNGRA